MSNQVKKKMQVFMVKSPGTREVHWSSPNLNLAFVEHNKSSLVEVQEL